MDDADKNGQVEASDRVAEIKTVERPDLVYDAQFDVFVPDYVTLVPRNVWLTFDDGPHPANTASVLTTLAAAQLKATFFIVGANANSHRDVVRRIADAGHRIGNHTYSHLRLPQLSEADVRNEIMRTDTLLSAYMGADKVLRPPYGESNATVDRIIRECGYRSVLWTVDTEDWSPAQQPSGWVQNGLNQIARKPSCIVLMHDIHKSTADNLRRFIDGIRAIPDVVFKSPSDL